MDQMYEFAEKLSFQAGAIIKENFLKGVKREWKDDDTPITATDKAVNDLVIKEINKSYPTHAILAEEKNDLRDSEYVWVCDPIDGTIPFSHGYPTCVFTLALVHNGKVVVATIYDPFIDRMLIAKKGGGAYLNGKQVFVSDSKSLQNTVIELAAWQAALHDLTPLFKELIFKGCQATSIRSTVYAGMLVAMGQFAGVIFAGKTAWDAAAIKLIVEEAGGRVTDLLGNDQRYDGDINGFIASNKFIHEELVSMVKPMVS